MTTHPHLVSEPSPRVLYTEGAWMRIIHCNILNVITIPKAINPATSSFRITSLVVEALGAPRSLRVLPPGGD